MAIDTYGLAIEIQDIIDRGTQLALANDHTLDGDGPYCVPEIKILLDQKISESEG